MKADPRLPDDTVNVSQTHPLKEAIILLIGIASISTLIFVIIAFFVNITAPLIPYSVEAKLLSLAWKRVEKTMDTEQKSQGVNLKNLANRLATHWPDNPYTYHVGIIHSPAANAFALSGGLILVTSSLLESAESENEMAFVLGHELGHFRNRDHLKALGRGILFKLLISAIGLSSGANLGSLAGTAELLTNRSFSRKQERAADIFGLSLMHQEYGHLKGSDDFFNRLPEEAYNDSSIADFAGTHPGTQQRIAELYEFAEGKGWTWNGPLRPAIAAKPSLH